MAGAGQRHTAGEARGGRPGRPRAGLPWLAVVVVGGGGGGFDVFVGCILHQASFELQGDF